MGRSALVVLILAEILMVQQAVAVRSYGSEFNPTKVVIRTEDESHGVAGSIADPPLSSGAAAESSSEGGGVAEPPEMAPPPKHHSSDKSVAGGGVIIGGLVTAIFAAVYCYIRVTRRRDGDKH